MLRVGGGLTARWQKAERLRAVLPIMASICVIGTGNALLTTTVSLKLAEPAIDQRLVQLLLTAFPVGFLGGCLSARFLVSRFGHEQAYLAVGLLAACATGGFMFTAELPVWFFLRLMNGFAMATLIVVSESWINLYADQHNRGAYFSIYMLMTSLAVMFGQLLVKAAGPHSSHLFLIALAVSLTGFLYARFVGGRWPNLPLRPLLEREGTTASGHRFGIWQLAVLAPVTAVGVFQAGATNMNVYTMTPLYGERMGIDAVSIVSHVTAFSLGGMLAQVPIGCLSDHVDHRILLLAQGFSTAGLCASIAIVGNGSDALLFALFFVYGMIALTIYPVGIAYANSRLDSRHMISASGGLLLLYSVGNILTPAAATGLMERLAPQALFVLLGSGPFLVAIAACVTLLRRTRVGVEPCPVAGGKE